MNRIKDKNKTKAELIKELKTLRKEREKSALNDLTEHKQIEEKYPSFTKDILDASAVGIFILDSDFKVVWISRLTEKYFGLQREKVIGKDKRKLIKKNIQHIFEDPDEFIRKVFATYNNNTYIENFECHVLPDGKRKERWLEHWSQPIKFGLYAGGRIEHYYDITERKQAEENLKNTRDELQMIMDSVPALIIYKDIEGKIIRANKTMANSLKMLIKDMKGKAIEELFPKEQAEKMRKDDQEVIISGKPKRDIIQPYTTPDGIRWAITDKMPYKDKEGKIIGVIAFAKDITVQRKSEQKLQQSYQRLKKTMDATIDTMSKIIEAKDPYTSGHQHRVCQLAVPLARELGFAEDKIEGVRIASLIHDIGKIGLPTEILSKPTKLTDTEFSLIKGHSQIGYDILKSIDFLWPIAQIVLQHHERLDGSGYPNNLKGDEIILEAKIIGVADVVEAMSSHRPYRPALGIDAALEEISKNKGILYDPEVVDICLKLFKEKEFKF